MENLIIKHYRDFHGKLFVLSLLIYTDVTIKADKIYIEYQYTWILLICEHAILIFRMIRHPLLKNMSLSDSASMFAEAGLLTFHTCIL